MVVQNHMQLSTKVKELKEQRKNGELTIKAYYAELLNVLTNLTDSLIGELDNIEDADIRSQIPLLVVILDDQIRAFGDRE